MGSYSVVIDGDALFSTPSDTNFVIAGSLTFDRSIGKRSQASFTVHTNGNTHYQEDQAVQIYDQNSVLAFSGYIKQPQEHKPGFQSSLIHTITCTDQHRLDRKSTRLNSSHTVISYAVFCLKKNKVIDLILTNG